MGRMYFITLLFSLFAFVMARSYIYGPQAPLDNEGAGYLYGAMFPAVILSVWWNVANFKGTSMPLIIARIRIPLAAITLGVNSAYYDIIFSNPEFPGILQTSIIKVNWLVFEALLSVALVIGIRLWSARHSSQ